MLTLLAAAVIGNPVSEVEAFFPLDTGRTWVYQDSAVSGDGFVDTVGNSQEVGGKPAVPIITTVSGKVDGSTFYRIENDEVLVVAFEQNNPLPSPYPILKLGSGKNNWEYQGSTQWLGSAAPMTVRGSAKRNGSKQLFGEKRETVQVTLDAVIGNGEGVSIKSKQVCLYAKGIGLVEMTDTTTINKTKSERKRTLVSYKPGSEG